MVWIGPEGRGGRWLDEAELPALRAVAYRWIEHLQKRIAFERSSAGQDAAVGAVLQQDIKVGGHILHAGEWLKVMRVNRYGGRVVSVTTDAKHARVRTLAQIEDYKAPATDVEGGSDGSL